MYLELLFLYNAGITFVLLWLCSRVLGEGFSLFRALLCAGCAGLCALLAVLPLSFGRLSAWVCLPVAAAFAWRWRGWLQFFRRLSLLLGATAMAAGISLLLCGKRLPTGLMLVLLSAAALFLCALGLEALYARRSGRALRAGTYLLTVQSGGRRLKLVGLLDTGNQLTEPITGLSVLILSAPAYNQVAAPRREITLCCATAAGTDTLKAQRAEEIRIYENGRWRSAGEGYIAGGAAFTGAWDALIPPAFFD